MDEIMKLSEEDFEEYREIFQDVLALPHNKLSLKQDLNYAINMFDG